MSTTGARRHDEDRERLLAELDSAGRFQRSVLAEAEALTPGPAEERLLAALPRDDARLARRRARRPLVLGLVAAVLLCLGWLVWSGRGAAPQRGDDEVLGASLALVQPLGETASFEIFRWKAAEHARWYVVVVLDATTGAEIDRSSELEDTRWQVAPLRWRSWPRAIRWEVRPFDAGGRPGRPASGSASLSR